MGTQKEMENLTDFDKRDEVENVLMRVKASLSAAVYLMGPERRDEPALDDIELWLGDLSDRIDAAIDLLGKIGLKEGGH